MGVAILTRAQFNNFLKSDTLSKLKIIAENRYTLCQITPNVI